MDDVVAQGFAGMGGCSGEDQRAGDPSTLDAGQVARHDGLRENALQFAGERGALVPGPECGRGGKTGPSRRAVREPVRRSDTENPRGSARNAGRRAEEKVKSVERLSPGRLCIIICVTSV